MRHATHGRIHWFIAGGMGMASGGGSSASAEVAAWVPGERHRQTIDGVTMHDLGGATG